MAFTTGPDFLSGILGASNSTDVLNKFKSDTGQEDFYQGLRNRYGERIGEDGYLIGGAGTMDFIDSDRDGIDDRHQAGPGQPKAGSNLDGNPIFGGGNPPPGGGNNADARQAARDAAMQDSYGMNPDGTISQYDASTGLTTNYNYNDEGLSFPQRFFGTAMTAANMVPTTGSLISGIISSLGSTAYDKFIDPVDQALANALGFTPEEGEYDNSAAAAALSLLGPTSYETLNREAIENSLANLAYKEQINSLAEVDPALRERLTSFGDDLSIADYNEALTASIPTSAYALTTPNPLAAYQAATATNEFGRTQAEQDAVNASIEQGNLVGFGQNEDGDFAGTLTYGGFNPGTGETNPVGDVTTGFNVNTTPNINNPAAVAAISANATPAQLGIVRPAIGTSGGGEGSGGGGGKSCFVKGTMLQMADGTKKEISTVELGDNTKGGIVEMTMQGLPQTIYNYKDVLVSGSHWVIEDNEFVAVEDSKHGVLTDKVEPVYTLKTSDHRMWINDIEFGDFETGSDNDWEPHFEMVRKKLNKELSEKTT